MTDLWSFVKSKWFFLAQNIVTLILIAAVAILLTLLILGSKENTYDNLDPNYAAESVQILSAMNREADPCEDFYRYACGGYVANEPVDLDVFDVLRTSPISQLSMLPRMFNKMTQNRKKFCSSEVKMAQLYHSCMDEFATVDDEGYLDIKFMNTSLQQTVESVHKWFQDKFSFNIYKSVSNQSQYSGPYHSIMWTGDRLGYRNVNLTSPLFSYNPYEHDENEIVIGQPEDSMMESLLPITDSTINENVLDFLLDLIYEPFNVHSSEKDALRSNLIETIQNLINIRNFTGQESASTDQESASTEQESASTEQIEFLMQFENLVPEWFKQAYEKDSSSLSVRFLYGVDYFEQLNSSHWIMNPNNLMQLQFLSILYVTIQETVEETNQGCRLGKIISDGVGFDGSKSKCAIHARDRETFCLRKLCRYYEFALISANAFMKHYTGERSFHEIERLTENIRESILLRIDDSIKNATTKVGLREYVNRIMVRPRVEQIECAFSDNLIENFELEIDEFTPFSLNLLRMWEFYQNKSSMERYPDIFSMALFSNAFYFPKSQQVRFLTFFIHSLYSDQHHIPSLYGGIGSVLAHEFGHSLDPTIVPEYYLGALMDPKTNATINNFAQCLTDIYNHEGISGETSLSDNYADIFGVQVMVDTFKREEDFKAMAQELSNSAILHHFTPEQLMFLSYGQTECMASVNSRKSWNTGQSSHAPGWARVNVALSVIPEFAKAFECSPDSYMTSGHQCKIWP